MYFCTPKMATAFLAFLAVSVATVNAYAEVKTPRDTPYSVTNTNFYYLTGNYTVGSKEKLGTFQVREMNLHQDTWVIFYTKPQADKVLQPPCEDSLRNIPQGRIMKIYTNQTVKVSSDVPDQWTVRNNTIVCFQVLQKASNGEWGTFTYKYEDTCRKQVVTESRPMASYYKYKSITVRSHKRCFLVKSNFSTVVDFQMTLKNATSLDRVIVTAERVTMVKQCTNVRKIVSGYYQYVWECKHVPKVESGHVFMMITGQTPDKFLQKQWPLVLTNSSHVCFEFQAVEDVVFKDDVLFRISEFPVRTGVITNRTGALVSPGYPRTPYMNHTSCTWSIKVRPGERIFAKFGDTQSDCTNDYIMLSGVEGGSHNDELLCGDSVTGRSFISTSNELVVKFRTGTYRNLKGFLLNYTVIGCSLQQLTFTVSSVMLNLPKNHIIPAGFVLRVGCKQGTVFPSKVAEVKVVCLADNTWSGNIPFCIGYTVCNDTLTAPSGHLFSPGYPHPYPRNTRCSWVIRVKTGQRILIRFEDIKSSCTNDYITLDGIEQKAVTTAAATSVTPSTTITENTKKSRKKRAISSSPTQFMICGSDISAGQEFTSVGPTVDIKFRSDIFQENGYFNISYTALGCSGNDIRKPLNVLLRNQAAYYPTGYRLELSCAAGFSFPGGTNIIDVVCDRTGTWAGKIPLCVRWRSGL